MSARDSSWLCARLHATAPLQDTLLAEGVPAILEILPAEVDRWFFQRHAGRGPYLRLCFRGSTDALWTDLLLSLRLWAADLVDNGILDRLSVAMSAAIEEEAGLADPSRQVCHADSQAVLAQVRLARAEAVAVPPLVLAAVGMAELARAFCGDTGWRCQLGSLRPAFVRSGADVAAAAPEVGRLVDRASRATSGEWALLAPSWAERAEVVARHGDAVRASPAAGDDAGSVPRALEALLRAHHNRAVPAGAGTAADALALLCRALATGD